MFFNISIDKIIMNKEIVSVVWIKRDLCMQDIIDLYSVEQTRVPYVII